MALSKQEFSSYIKQFQFREMFNDMGWDNDATTTTIVVDDITYQPKAVAIKCGLKILTLNVDEIPLSDIRKKIDKKITRLFYHYILIFNDRKSRQVWMVPVTKNQKRELVFVDFFFEQDVEFLYQKVKQLTFALEEEERLTIVDVSKRVNDVFVINSEKITSDFYKDFSKQHQSFLKFLKDFGDKITQEWYASLMLNRLMFCYFIQKKSFLNNDVNYLRNKLNEVKEKKGKDKFFDFYYDFLKTLFHKGLGAPEHSSELKKMIGNIPYLNGGLFDEHEIEKDFPKAKIPDKAFKSVFDFFDEWQWHLNNSITSSGRDINPDVIGYIFEKYINDRAQMGAYYTKEDITDYISKNCILPFLFDETKRNYSKAFSPDAELWQMVKQGSDTYIYDAVKKGVSNKLPDEVAAGIKEVNNRNEWNKPAASSLALPTEIWREVINRRNHYAEIKSKVERGDIQNINDFITYNLNIRQFAVDAVANTNDPDFLRAFYKTLNSVTIIDPTCGSGAFLFAAMNILEELYEQCIQRMQNFVSDAPKGKYKFFEETIAQVTAPEHPNLQYFIYKSIILRNLYGVDIMKEAVEIAKLRLFLKLVATVQADYHKPNLGLEPLPDIDFNIRSGNTLVGFATEAELKEGLAYTLDGLLAQPVIEEKCDVVAKAFSRYKEIQLTFGDDYKTFKKAKEELQKRLKELNHEMNLLLHKQAEGLKYEKWIETHQPFHWFAEFYEIIQNNKGFDIIIGNPPYTQVSKSFGRNYLKKYESALDDWSRDENLYTMVLEQCFNLINTNGLIGMILPLSVTFSTKKPFINLRRTLQRKKSHWWWLHFDRIPSGLFGNEIRTRCTILLKSSDVTTNNNYTTPLKRWESDYREHLFNTSIFSRINIDYTKNFPKVGSQIQADSLTNLLKSKKILEIDLTNSIAFSKLKSIAPNFPEKSVYVGGTAYNWFPVWREIPETFDEKGKESLPARTAGFLFNKESDANIVFALLCSSLGYWWWAVASDGFNLKKWLVSSFPISLSQIPEKSKNELSNLGKILSVSLKKQYVFKENKGKIGNFFLPACADEIEAIDNYLANHLEGLSKEFFDDIRSFNNLFSRASSKIDDDIEEDDDE